jgi:hypothetical protein
MNHFSGLVTLSILFILLLLYLIPKSIGAIDRPLAGIYPSALRHNQRLAGVVCRLSHLTKLSRKDSQVIGYMRAFVWSVPIQNRINRNQGNLSHRLHYSTSVHDAPCASAHNEKFWGKHGVSAKGNTI